jgi:uncharacterized protein (DUF58 family)
MKLITVAIAALFLLVVSAVLKFGELYIMSAAIACVPISSYLVGRYVVRNLKCSRETPDYTQEGHPFPVGIRLHGKSGMLGPMEIHDSLPEWFEKHDERQYPSEESADSIVVTYTAGANKRGEHTLGPLKLKVSDPLGFFLFTCEYPLFSHMVVLPKSLEIPELQVRAGGSFGEYQYEGSGVRGSGTDFHGVREYKHGDELRRVHWASTARHGRLNVIEFEHRRAQDSILAIDLKRGSEVHPGRYSSLEYAIRIAAGVAEQTLTLGSAARILAAGIEGPASTPGAGFDQLYVVLDALARMQADRTESLADAILAQMDSISKDSVVTCLSSTIDEKLAVCAQLLSPRGVKLHMVLIEIAGSRSRGDDAAISQLMASGASITVVECSTDAIEGHVTYDY